MSDIQFYAYIHRRPDGSAFYVGKGHAKRAWNFYDRNQYHKNVVAKYGRENITVEIVNAESETHAFELEKALIRIMRRHEYSITNMSIGGEGPVGYRHTDESKAKIRKSSMGRKHMVGKSPTEETKATLREKAKQQWAEIKEGKRKAPARTGHREGVYVTDEVRKKIGDAHRGVPCPPEVREKLRIANTGQKRSAETCARIRLCQKGKIVSDDARKKMSDSAKLRYAKAREQKSEALTE